MQVSSSDASNSNSPRLRVPRVVEHGSTRGSTAAGAPASATHGELANGFETALDGADLSAVYQQHDRVHSLFLEVNALEYYSQRPSMDDVRYAVN